MVGTLQTTLIGTLSTTSKLLRKASQATKLLRNETGKIALTYENEGTKMLTPNLEIVNLTPWSASIKDFLEDPLELRNDGIVCKSNHTLTKPPWFDDGLFIFGQGQTNLNSDDLWGLKDSPNINLYQLVAAFYLLESIINGALPNQKKVEVQRFSGKIAMEMQDEGLEFKSENREKELIVYCSILQERMSRYLAHLFRNYFHVAIAGEGCHHPFINYYLGKTSNYPQVRHSWKLLVDKVGGELPAKWAKECFEDGVVYGNAYSKGYDSLAWGGGFGGPPWAGIAEVLYWYEKGSIHGLEFGDKAFCDRAFSLQHNGGCALNKINWSMLPDKVILDAHHQGAYDKLIKYSPSHIKVLAYEATGKYPPPAERDWSLFTSPSHFFAKYTHPGTKELIKINTPPSVTVSYPAKIATDSITIDMISKKAASNSKYASYLYSIGFTPDNEYYLNGRPVDYNGDYCRCDICGPYNRYLKLVKLAKKNYYFFDEITKVPEEVNEFHDLPIETQEKINNLLVKTGYGCSDWVADCSSCYSQCACYFNTEQKKAKKMAIPKKVQDYYIAADGPSYYQPSIKQLSELADLFIKKAKQDIKESGYTILDL